MSPMQVTLKDLNNSLKAKYYDPQLYDSRSSYKDFDMTETRKCKSLKGQKCDNDFKYLTKNSKKIVLSI